MAQNLKAFAGIVAVGILGLSQAARADDVSGLYLGTGAGQISIADVNGHATGYKVFLGARVSPFFDLEAGYINAGTVNISLSDPYEGVYAYGESKFTAAQFSLLGRIPLSPYFALFGRAGGIYWRDDESAVAYSYYGSYADSGSETGTAFEWGAGAEASFGHFALRAEFERANINSYTYQLISGSVIYHF